MRVTVCVCSFHFSLASWAQENESVLAETADDLVPVVVQLSPVIAAALGHLLQASPALVLSSSNRSNSRQAAAQDIKAKSLSSQSFSPRIHAQKVDANKSLVQAMPVFTGKPSPRLKRLNLGDFVLAESGRKWMDIGEALNPAKQQELLGSAAANSLRPEELPTTPSLNSPSNAAMAAVTGTAASGCSVAAPCVLSSDIKFQLIFGAFISGKSAPTISHDFSSLQPPTLPSPRSVWSLPPPSLRHFPRRVCQVEEIAKESESRLSPSPALVPAPHRQQGQVLVISDEKCHDLDGDVGTSGMSVAKVFSDTFDRNTWQLRLGPISAQQKQQLQQQPPHCPEPKRISQSDSPRLKYLVAKPIKGPTVASATIAAATSNTAFSDVPPLSAVAIAHLNFQTLAFADSIDTRRNQSVQKSVPLPSVESASCSAIVFPRQASSEPLVSSRPLFSSMLPNTGEVAENTAKESTTFAKLVKLEQK
jgi:hypothetical protein